MRLQTNARSCPVREIVAQVGFLRYVFYRGVQFRGEMLSNRSENCALCFLNGAGSVTPMQLTAGFAVFANGGYRVNPFLITRITDHAGKVLVESQPAAPVESNRAIDARNAFIMNTLLQEVARGGTAAKAQATLKRPDLFGKTGTTNDSMDAEVATQVLELKGERGYDLFPGSYEEFLEKTGKNDKR